MNDRADQCGAGDTEPLAGTTPGLAADELFAHGLLRMLAEPEATARDARVRRLMRAIPDHARVYRLPWARVRRWGAAAAILLAGAGAVFVAAPFESSAQAVVRDSIAALRSGDRRYEVRMMREMDTALGADPAAVVDMSAGGLLLIRCTGPGGRQVVVGRDGEGDWAIRRDGGVEREHPEVAWPRWATVGDESLFADSVDRLLEAMAEGYTLEKRGAEELEGRAGRKFDHLVGEKSKQPRPGADRIELWVDRDSRLLERLEMRWDTRPALRRPPEGRPDGPLDGARERPDGAPPMGPHGGPLDRPPPGGPGGPDRLGIKPPPWFPVGPMGPGPGERPMPPRLLVLERTEAPTFAPGWFSPGSHTP